MTTKRFPAASLLTLCVTLLASGARADHFGATWLADNLGIWEQDGVWSTQAYPNNGHTIPAANGDPIPGPNPTYDVLISNPSPCTLGIGVRVQTVNVLQGSTLGINGSLWANTGFGNAGLITLNSTGNFTGMLRAGANSNVVAGGEIFMSDSFSNSVTAGAGGKVLTIFAGGRIRGAGNVNQYHGDDVRTFFQIVNHGLIEAMQPNNALRILLTYQATDAMINDGTLRASGQGVLHIRAAETPENVLNQGGTIEAIDNGTVRLERGVTLTGGTLATSGNGTIRGDYPSVSDGGTFKDVVNIGTMAVGPGETFHLAGTFTNNGLVSLDGTDNFNTGLLIRGSNVLLAGNGLFTLNGPGIFAGDNPGQTVTIGAGQTLRGNGRIGNVGFGHFALNVVNQGLIDATGPLTLFVEDISSSNFANTGTLRASSGALLRLGEGERLGFFNNAGGTISALDGSTVRIAENVTVTGGTFTTSGTGTIRGVSLERGGLIRDVTNNGTIAITGGELLRAANTLTNNGLVQMEGQGSALLLRGDLVINGTGQVLSSTQGGRPAIAGEEVVGRTFTLRPGATIRGGCEISFYNSGFGKKAINVVNQGLIEATQGITHYFDGENPSLTSTNTGIYRANGAGSTMDFNSNGALNNNGGAIEAINGGTVLFQNGARLANLSSGTLTGGTYRVVDTGSGATLQLNSAPITTNAATVILSGLNAQFPQINSLTQNNGTLVLNDGATRTFSGTAGAAARSDQANATFPNAGTMIIGNNSSLNINGDFAQGSNSRLEVIISSANQPIALNVSGTAALAGRLDVKLANGYTPPAGATFPILNAASVTGGFVQVTGANVTYGPNGVSVQPTGNTNAFQMTSAVSRKTHGNAGTFDVLLPGVECRAGGGNHTLVFTFSNTIASGSASVIGGTASLTDAPTINGNTMTLNLSGVASVQQVQVQLDGIADVYSQVLPATTVSIGFLVGDTNGDRFVNSGDATQTRSRSGQVTNATNFRSDVNVDGSVNSGDAFIVRSRSGTALP